MVAQKRRRLRAAQGAEEIADYIAKDSLEAAVRFLENTESTLRDLAEFTKKIRRLAGAGIVVANSGFVPTRSVVYADGRRKCW